MKRFPPRVQEQADPAGKPAQETPAITTSPQPSKGLQRALASLHHRNYRLYSFGQTISLMGTQMQTVGQAWLVLELTHSALQLGLVGALQYLPVLLFSLFGGVFADRWPKRRVLFFTQSAAMLQALLLWALIATHAFQLWHMYVLTTLLGLTTSLDQPTRSAFVVEMVGREDLPNAVALNSSLTNLTRIIGPGLGGLIIVASDVTELFLLNALSFLAVIVALALIDTRTLHAQALQRSHAGARAAGEKAETRFPQAPAAGPGPRQSTWQSLREGVAYVWKTPAILLVTLVVGLLLLFGANFSVVLPLFATDVLHVGAPGFGFLSAAMGIGALLSALWLAWGNIKPTIRRVLISALVFSGLEAAFAVSPLSAVSVVLIAGVGAAEAVCGALAITTLQTVTPDHLRGRVTSVYILFFTGSIPPGYLLAGWLSGLYGASLGLLICMLLCLLVVGVGWLWRKPAEQNITAATHW